MSRNFAAAAVVAAVLAALLVGCGHRRLAGQSQPAPSVTASTSAATSTAELPPSSRSNPSEPAAVVLADGRYPAYLTALDTRARTVTFDVIQYLTGEEAREAYHRDHPEISEGPPNGYYIVNQNPRLRTLPVRDNAPILVLWLGAGLGSDMITIDQLPGYFAKDPVADKYLWYDPFWLTVRGGRIDALAEQYIP